MPVGGHIKTLELPGTITNFTIRDQKLFESVTFEGYTALSTLRVENTPNVPVKDIINAAGALNRVRVLGVDWRYEDDAELTSIINKLYRCIGMDAAGNNTDTAVVVGRVYVPKIGQSTLMKAQKMGLTVEYDELYVYTPKLVERTISGYYENDRVDTIGDYALAYATKLTAVSFPAVTTVGQYGLHRGEVLTTVDLPMATSLGNNSLSDCWKLETVNIPRVKTIGSNVFNACNAKLTKLDMPSVTSIDSAAFTNCYSLVTLILRSDTVVELKADNVFNGCCHYLGTTNGSHNPNGLKDGYIYVPAALVDSYKVANRWSVYANQIRAIEDYPEICGGV